MRHNHSLGLSEKLESQSLVDLGSMLELLGVVVEGGIVSANADVGSLSQVIAGEEIHKEEASELQAVLVGTEHVLVVQEVSSEEEDQTFEVNNLWVFDITYHARFAFHFQVSLY